MGLSEQAILLRNCRLRFLSRSSSRLAAPALRRGSPSLSLRITILNRLVGYGKSGCLRGLGCRGWGLDLGYGGRGFFGG